MSHDGLIKFVPGNLIMVRGMIQCWTMIERNPDLIMAGEKTMVSQPKFPLLVVSVITRKLGSSDAVLFLVNGWGYRWAWDYALSLPEHGDCVVMV